MSVTQAYWSANLRLIAACLVVWLIVSIGCGVLAVNWLNQFHLAGYPLGFWFGQQGSILVFVLLAFFYAWQMKRLDRRFKVQE